MSLSCFVFTRATADIICHVWTSENIASFVKWGGPDVKCVDILSHFVSVSGCEFSIRDSSHLKPFIHIPFLCHKTKYTSFSWIMSRSCQAQSLGFYFCNNFVKYDCTKTHPSDLRPPQSVSVYLAVSLSVLGSGSRTHQDPAPCLSPPITLYRALQQYCDIGISVFLHDTAIL